MTYNLSTRAVGSPKGTMGRFAPSRKPMAVVPLSVFFLDAEREKQSAEQGDDMLYGLRRGRAAEPGKGQRKKKKQPVSRARTRNGRDKKTGGELSGGGSKTVDQAVSGGEGQSTASQTPQESVTMATGTPLVAPGGSTRPASWPGGASKLGATRGTTGATSSGNVAQYPVPIGGTLRRVSPAGKAKKVRKRKKKKQESRDRWIGRLGKLMQS